LFIEPGSPWENGYCESFNGKLRDEVLRREVYQFESCLLGPTRCQKAAFRPSPREHPADQDCVSSHGLPVRNQRRKE